MAIREEDVLVVPDLPTGIDGSNVLQEEFWIPKAAPVVTVATPPIPRRPDSSQEPLQAPSTERRVSQEPDSHVRGLRSGSIFAAGPKTAPRSNLRWVAVVLGVLVLVGATASVVEHTKLSHTRKILATVSAELDAARTKLLSVTNELESTKGTLASTKASLVSTQTSLSSSQSELSTQRAKVSSLEAQISALEFLVVEAQDCIVGLANAATDGLSGFYSLALAELDAVTGECNDVMSA
jgi:hypothetical protein